MEHLIRRWRQLSVWLPAGYVAAASAIALAFHGYLSGIGVVLLITALTALGAAVFSALVFRVLGRAQRQTERRARELAAVNQASLALSSELDLASVLQRVVDLSRGVINARYGALAMLDEAGRVAEFLTSGMSRDERARIGRPPEGSGLLGVVIREGEALRVDCISDHPRSAGFPPWHPAMTSFIGLPIVYEGRILGDLYLTDKNGGDPFTKEDEDTLRIFAAHASIAIENARLYRQVQDLAVLEERDRIGMDLHDGVIQALYATGLKLETCLEDVEEQPKAVADELERAIGQLNQVIADIRSYVFRLRPGVLAHTDLAGAVGALLQELKVNALTRVELSEEPGACQGLSEDQTSELFLVAQEAITNARKHARASCVFARLERQGSTFRMSIADDGAGFDPDVANTGQGLHNMRDRVERLGGTIAVQSQPGDGATVLVELLLAAKGEG